jgi:hypothetical protein
MIFWLVEKIEVNQAMAQPETIRQVQHSNKA